jgi:hypothetical protein
MAARRRVDGVFCVAALAFRDGEPRITERTDASSLVIDVPLFNGRPFVSVCVR